MGRAEGNLIRASMVWGFWLFFLPLCAFVVIVPLVLLAYALILYIGAIALGIGLLFTSAFLFFHGEIGNGSVAAIVGIVILFGCHFLYETYNNAKFTPSIDVNQKPVGTGLIVPRQEIELLHNARTVLGVSSSSNSQKLSPRSMVDRDFETAWNSQTGDLIGAQISLEVPAAAHVNTLKLTVGFTGSNKKGDLFVRNHRLRKIALARNGLRIGEFGLDPENRGFQTIPVNRDGGKYTIEVLETLPGSKANWREVCVSEIEVWGFLPPNERPSNQLPQIIGASEAKTTAPEVLTPTKATSRPEAEPHDDATAMSSAHAESLLSDAQQDYVNGDFEKAITRARLAANTNPVRAWRIIGAAGCNRKDVKVANEAYQRMSADSRQYLIYTCQRQGITLDGSQFKLNEN